jgi:hypothetical protein
MSLSSRMSTEFWLKTMKSSAFRNVRPIGSVEFVNVSETRTAFTSTAELLYTRGAVPLSAR